MAQTQIRGASQIQDGTIPASKFVSGLNLTTLQLADAPNFILRTGVTAFTAAQSMGGFNLTNLADPVGAQDGVNLRTAQALINGIAIKPSVRALATANITLTALQTIDGVTLVAGDRVLLINQTTQSQNGPWVASATAWTRPTDWSTGSTQKEGILILVAEGTTYTDTKFLSVTYGIMTVDTTATTWVQDRSGIIYTNGNGISLIGSAFAVKTGNGIAFDGSNNVTITPNGTALTVAAAGLSITNGTAGQLMLAGTAGLAAFTSILGDVTVSGTGVTTVNASNTTGFVKYTANVYNEIPSGLVNNTNTTFNLVTVPAVASLELFYNGVLLEPGAGNDYTISGTTITTLFAPVLGDKLRGFYIK